MRTLVCAILLALAQPAAAEEGWSALTGDAAQQALVGHVLAYPNGATQKFTASGDTSYDSGHLQAGRWQADANGYCSVWPPSDRWTCYRLDRSADGRSLRFTAADGSATIGRYADPD
ncbi:MAG: hypothetical protein JSR87_11720 [Proteobacteria bacterium]|nr:hypothetical protein [Pseudomonadota bacterium]MBS0572296.1 hypothetical protein [Pseudomonadota bacterium]